MTTTIERITAIIDEATADERAKVLDLERRLSDAYAELVEKKAALTETSRELVALTVENSQQRAEIAHLGRLNAEQDEQIRALRDMPARATPATDDAELIVALRHKCDDLKETVDALNADRDGLLAEVTKRDATIAALEIKNRALVEELGQQPRAFAQEFWAHRRLQRANEPAGYVEPSKEVVELLTKIDNLENKLDSVTRTTSKQIERLTREKATAYRKLGEVSRKCLGLMKEAGRLRVVDAQKQHALVDQDMLVTEANKQIDELTEKCAALVVERDRLIGEKMNDGWPCHSPTAVVTPDLPTLRIDPDMSNPQPGKLLVVRLEDEDVSDMQEGHSLQVLKRQFVGFLVETPAVEEPAAEKRAPKAGDRVRRIDDGGDGAIGIVEYIGAISAGVRFIRPGAVEHLHPSMIELIEAQKTSG